MQKRTREIIALVLLVVLCIGGISAMAWYILVGHNWNATATSIDDRIGNMDGYTVVLCEGSAPSRYERFLASIGQPMLEEESFGLLAGEDAAGPEGKLTVREAIESYEEKGAQVIAIQVDEPNRYADPVIIQRGGKRFAIFYVSGPRSDLAARNVVKGLARYEVDCSICIVDDMGGEGRGMGPVDVVFCRDYEMAGEEGRYLGKSYAMGTPYHGQVGAVIISPSGFLTSKMLDVA